MSTKAAGAKSSGKLRKGGGRAKWPRTTRLLLAVGGLVLVVGGVYLAGPKVDAEYRPRPVVLGPDLDRALADSEQQLGDVVPGAEKGIVWAKAAGTRTPYTVVYLHGFSATRRETAPLCDRLAASLGANLFYTRFTGHGQPGARLAEATVSDWLNDGVEALEVGKRIGERVIVVGTSTGGTIALWLALNRPEAVQAAILLAPNFGPKDWRANLLTLRWGRQVLPPLFGETRRRAPGSEAEMKYWTTEYPTQALFPMMALVEKVKKSRLEAIETPVLVVYSPQDKVVDPLETERGFMRIGSPVKAMIPFEGRPGSPHHVLAGDILAPQDTDAIATIILGFLKGAGVPKQEG